MLVKEVMNDKVLTAPKETLIRDAARIMTKYRIGSLVILEKSKLIGIVTERDILGKVVARGDDPRIIKIEDIMTTDVISIQDDDTVEKAVELMTEHKIKKLPVLHEERLVGIITASDIIVIQPKMIDALCKLLQIREQKLTAA
ncbi:MAG: CBS domain-containing protein [Candidatus Aenigmarchaeota archaeon]|nr:CBS domain-containing protein [Candidatus Aenigmarchaeota archaeon]